MLNATMIIRRIEKKLGFKFMDLEITHEEIIEDIQDEPLRVFSKYYPYQETVVIDPNNHVDGFLNRFYLNTENEPIGINRMIGGSLLGANYVTGLLHPVAADMLLGDPISRQLNIDLMSFTSNPITFEYIEPGIIEIKPMYNNVKSYVIVVNVVHPKHFGTIPVGLEKEFIQYALYDIQSTLYAQRMRFSNIQTPFGSMELYLDQFSNAEDKKEELEEKFRRYSGKSGKRKKVIIA